MATKKAKKASKELRGSRVKFRFRRHVLPIVAGLVMFIAIFLLLNSQLISGVIAYQLYSKRVNVAAADATTSGYSVDPTAPPRIIINKINVTAPVNFTETRVNQYIFLQDLHDGTVHYPGTALPGQTGNVAIFGHSSGVWWEPGHYKFVFTLLDQLTYGDKIFIEYKGVRYIYQVYNTMVVQPDDMSVLNQTGSHMLTLITCTPVGTSAKRLIIQAQQISPKVPDSTGYGAPATLPSTAQGQSALPSSDASLWDALRHLF